MNCFVPPILLKNVARRGSDELRDWAIEALGDGERLRGFREASGRMRQRGERRGLTRAVYDAQHARLLPGSMLRREGAAATGDLAVDEAYDGAGKTYLFFFTTMQRDSIDGNGLPLDSSVHYGRRYANAFWNGEQMVYGDGDGKLFHRFTLSLEVIAHELAHGVTQYEANLASDGQAGALNEHFSDVFGVLVKQHALKQTAVEADWLLGADLFCDGVKAHAVRSMKHPGTAYDDPLIGRDPQPHHMRDYLEMKDDDGGVHVNSGIPNKAFCELALDLGGHAWETAGRIWYVTLTDRLRKDATFQECADATLQVASDLYGRTSREQRAVRSAWKKVGLLPAIRLPRAIVPSASLLPIRKSRVALAPMSIGEEPGVRPEAFALPKVR